MSEQIKSITDCQEWVQKDIEQIKDTIKTGKERGMVVKPLQEQLEYLESIRFHLASKHLEGKKGVGG